MTSTGRKWIVRLAPFVVLVCLVGAIRSGIAADDPTEFDVTDTMVAMTDGVELATTIYRPKGEGPFPVIVARTPYNKDGLKGEGQRFGRNGYVFVAQDLRGRF